MIRLLKCGIGLRVSSFVRWGRVKSLVLYDDDDVKSHVHDDDDATTQVRDKIPIPFSDGLRRIFVSGRMMTMTEATLATMMRPLLKHAIRFRSLPWCGR